MISPAVLFAMLVHPAAAANPPLMRRIVDISPQGTPQEKREDPQSSLLEVQDVETIMEKAGVQKDVFNVKAFDKNGDGRLSRDELVGLGAAAKTKGLANKLAQLLPHQSEKEGSNKEDIALFKAADVDGSSLLEAREVGTVLAKTPLVPGSFNWRKYDFDGDGALNQGEFLAAGTGVLQEVKRQHQEALAAQQQASLLEQEVVSRETQVFQDADKNHNGFLEEPEMDDLNSRAGLTGFNWKNFDSDQDNRLSKAEFVRSGPAAAAFGEMKRLEPLLKRTKAGDDVDRKVFKKADTDGSSFLEKGEVESLLSRSHITTPLFNWHDFDRDHDGKLSEEEFLEGGPMALKASIEARPPSLVQESGASRDADEDDDLEALADKREDDQQVWLEFDKDRSGYLETNEIDRLVKDAEIKDFDWKAYDRDHDGRLSPAEFDTASDEAKEKASSQFRQKVQQNLGEETKEK